MRKNELIEAVGSKLRPNDVKNKAALIRAVNAVFDVAAEALAAGEPVQIAGFGNFKVKDRAARAARNPRTGEAMEIAASKAVAFQPSKALKEAVNGKQDA